MIVRDRRQRLRHRLGPCGGLRILGGEDNQVPKEAPGAILAATMAACTAHFDVLRLSLAVQSVPMPIYRRLFGGAKCPHAHM